MTQAWCHSMNPFQSNSYDDIKESSRGILIAITKRIYKGFFGNQFVFPENNERAFVLY